MVHPDLCNGNVEIEFEGEDGSSQQNNKHHKCCVLKVRQLHLKGTKLHPPPDTGVRGRGLETHGLPVGRLNVLEKEEGCGEELGLKELGMQQ